MTDYKQEGKNAFLIEVHGESQYPYSGKFKELWTEGWDEHDTCSIEKCTPFHFIKGLV